MAVRLFALWFSVLSMSLVAFVCSLTSEQYYHEYLHLCGSLDVLPNLSRLFFSKSGWLFYFPALFALPVIWVTWKWRENVDLIWCLVTINLGSTVIFFALFHLATLLPKFIPIRVLEG